MKINKEILGNALATMIQHNNVYYEMGKDYPDILADLSTFKHNPSCSCRAKVTKFFQEKIEQENLDLVEKYLTKDPHRHSIIEKIKEIAKHYEEKVLAGKIITLENTKEAWHEFWDSSKEKTFRAFAVAENNGKLNVYFL